MRKFTPTEISLCKKIAEKERKDSDEWGLYVYSERKGDKEIVLMQRWIRIKGKHLIWEDSSGERADIKTTKWFPLWQEHDCLEWLRERCKHHILLIHEEDEAGWWAWFDEYQETQQYDKGKTPLEALLRVVLAVMEGKE